MSNFVIALAIAGAMSVPASAQPAPAAEAQVVNQAQPAKPQMVKKLVCEDNDNPYSHISRICHTQMVPAQPAVSASNSGQPRQDGSGN